MAKMEEKEKIDFKYNFKLYWSFIKKQKLLFASILVLILLIESASLVDKFLFKALIDKGAEFLAQTLDLPGFTQTLIFIAICYIGITLFKVLAKITHLGFINKLEVKMIADLKRKFFNHLVHMDYNFHTTNRTGSLISKLTRIGGAVESMTDSITFNFTPLFLQLTISILSLVYFNWVSGVVTFITMIAFIAYSLFIQRIQEKANVAANLAEDTERANISDVFTNIESVKCFGKEDFVKKKYVEISDTTKEKTLRFWNYFRFLDSIQTLILGLGTFFLVYFTIIDFIKGNCTTGTLVFVYSVFSSLFGNLFSFVWGIRNFYRSMADFESLFRFGKLENAIKDAPDAKELEIKKGEIEFKNVNFKYGERTILKDFNLKVPKKKKIALVGHSGAGKTTVIKLLYRLYDINSGEITIDGTNINNVKQESLRDEMSIVPQECVLFNDTIYNNIKFSKPDATREEVMKAIGFAQLDKIIEGFSKKENTIVGERGVKLSGGEKQRVSIARAILADKKILILDEATSSLDSETEYEIQKDLKNLLKGRTSVVIAHRLSTIMSADEIIVIEKGKVVQKGTHTELIKQEGSYKKLWNMQKGGYIK
ncbi:MAG: ABC transporter ATP-binding protein [bacterium]|nr:ABC transporter ATP-binding protein [bacterium]